MNDKIELGDIVRIKGKEGRVGYVASIVDYGTHVCYFIELGDIIKFPAKLEWLELVEKGDSNEKD